MSEYSNICSPNYVWSIKWGLRDDYGWNRRVFKKHRWMLPRNKYLYRDKNQNQRECPYEGNEKGIGLPNDEDWLVEEEKETNREHTGKINRLPGIEMKLLNERVGGLLDIGMFCLVKTLKLKMVTFKFQSHKTKMKHFANHKKEIKGDLEWNWRK